MLQKDNRKKTSTMKKACLSLGMALCLLLCMLLSAWGCGRKTPAPEEILRAVCESQPTLPAGRIYVLSAPSDDAKHPPEPWLSASFGRGQIPPALSLVEDAAFFTSYSGECELAVFLCKTADGTDAVSQLCLQRLNILENYWEGVEKFNTSPRKGGVTVRGKWVILYLCENPEGVLRAFRRTL